MSGLAGQLARMRRAMPMLKAEITQKVIAVEAANFHNENFRSQAWEGRKKWNPRKDGDRTRSLLVKSGRLRRAATTPRVRDGKVDFIIPIYGKVHNRGLRSGRGGGFKMPRRQFAGQSSVLKKRFKRKATRIITKRLNRI